MRRELAITALALLVLAACAWCLWPRRGQAAQAPQAVARADAEITTSEATIEAEVSAHQVWSTPRVALPSDLVEAQAPTLRPTATTRAKPVDESPAGTIEGLVVRGKEPIVGAQVTLHTSFGTADIRPARDQRQIAATYTLADGTFRFDTVAPGFYTLLAVEGRSEREGTSNVSKWRPTPRVTLTFGKSRIRGTIYDVNGTPLAGCPLRLDYTARGTRGKTPSTVRSVTSTDAEGRYAFNELKADTYEILLSRPGKRWVEGWPGRTWYVRLAEDQDLVLDAGAQRGADHWTGVVRDRKGTTIPEVRLINLECHVPGEGVSNVITTILGWSSNTGAFDLPLEAGVWESMIDLGPPSGSSVGLGPCTVPVGGLQQDIDTP